MPSFVFYSLLKNHSKSYEQCHQQPGGKHNNNYDIGDAKRMPSPVHCSVGTVFGRLDVILKQGTRVLELSTHDLPSISSGDNSNVQVIDTYGYMLQCSSSCLFRVTDWHDQSHYIIHTFEAIFSPGTTATRAFQCYLLPPAAAGRRGRCEDTSRSSKGASPFAIPFVVRIGKPCDSYRSHSRTHQLKQQATKSQFIAMIRVYEIVVGKQGKKEYPHLDKKNPTTREETHTWKRMSRYDRH